MVKISIIGASGTIGKNVAFTLAREDVIDEVVMFSRQRSHDRVTGEVLDMYDALAAEDIESVLIPSCNIGDIADSDIVLISSGVPRKDGFTRLDLAVPNAKIIKGYAQDIAKYAPDAIILIVTNPVDVMTSIALKYSGFEKNRVIGLGNHLDSLRLKTILSKHFNIHSGEIHTRVIGEHGDHMVPLLSSTTIGGIPLKYFPRYTDLESTDLVSMIRNAGANIISKKGATEYGPSYAISNLIRTIINDSRKILTVSTYLEGEVEGVYDVSLGVPVILCKNGIQEIVPVNMSEYERREFFDAARTVKRCTYKIHDLLNEH
ncbi:MAG: malate dehydrogenase [Methanosphaera sp. rholeuAM270]|nr:MAG: malate dehydrogenase [Methanosphaera sp. rholeuAM270]